jgi:translation initiation factor 5
MPALKCKQESRLNGVKTNITNLVDVANALRVPDSAIIKYFCAEVGANQEQTSIVKGQHSPESLQKLLDKFIAKYVLCGRCNYPEVFHEVDKKDLLGVCNSCGFSKKMDVLHKAGKTLLKEIPNFYKANPDFAKRKQPLAGIEEKAQMQSSDAGLKKKKGKGDVEESKGDDEEVAKLKQEKIQKLIEQGHEISNLDAKEIKLDSEEIGKFSPTRSFCDDSQSFVTTAEVMMETTASDLQF